jgi:putative transposase
MNDLSAARASPKHPDSRYLARIKQPFSKQIKEILSGEQKSRLPSRLTVLERPGKTCFQFWQEGPGFESSAKYYHNIPPRQQHPNLPLIHGLPEGAII